MRFSPEIWYWRTKVHKMRGEKGKARVEMNERKKTKTGTDEHIEYHDRIGEQMLTGTGTANDFTISNVQAPIKRKNSNQKCRAMQ